jgi:hypothetical protein
MVVMYLVLLSLCVMATTFICSEESRHVFTWLLRKVKKWLGLHDNMRGNVESIIEEGSRLALLGLEQD